MNKNASSTAASHGNEKRSKRTGASHMHGKHSVNLQKRGSTRFQFGLIIAMALVYIGLEASFETFKAPEHNAESSTEAWVEYYPTSYTTELRKPVVKEPKSRVTKNPKFKIVPDVSATIGLEEFIDQPLDTSTDLPLATIPYAPVEDPVEEEVIFIAVEDKPIFPGCEAVDKEERLACFTNKMQKHIKDNFRYPDAAVDMGLKGKVLVYFKINTQGYISDVQLRGPHKILEKEASRIIGKLPKMTPGKQRGVPVRVPFSIPIDFQLH